MRSPIPIPSTAKQTLVVMAILTGVIIRFASAGAAQPTVTQSYSAGAGVLPGMVVGLKTGSQTTVEALASQNAPAMVGVVVPVNAAPIVLTQGGGAGQQVLVASTGRYNLLVTNQNGPVKANDYLSMSALAGIAMRADSSQKNVVGRAVGAFDGSHNVLGSVPLKGSLGRTITVAIGTIPADIRLGQNPAYQPNNQVPGFLNKLASSVANKPVSAVRIYLSVAVVVVILCIIAGMFYGGIRSGIIAIGRNPLAKKSIGRGLLQTVLFALVIFVAGVGAAYVILL